MNHYNPKSSKNPYLNLIYTIWHYGKPWRRTIVAFYIAFVFAQFFYSLSPYLFGKTIEVLQHFRPDRLYEVVWWLMGGLGFLFLFWVLHGPARVIERRVALKIQQSFRAQFYEKLVQLPLQWHQAHHSGNLLSRLSRASVALMRFGENQFIYVEAITKFITSLAFIVWISPLVGLMSMVTCIAVVYLIIVFDRRLIPLYDTQNELDNRVGSVLYDYVGNMTTIQTLRLGPSTLHHLKECLLKIWPFFKDETVINEVKWFAIMMLLTAMQSIILVGYIVASLKTKGLIDIGLVVMLFRYQWDLNEVFYLLSANYSELVRMNTDVVGIQPIVADIERLVSQEAIVEPVVSPDWSRITLEKLNYQIFKDFNLTINRGEKIALIGLSGAGKTTLLQLLRGLYEPKSVLLSVDEHRYESNQVLKSHTTLIVQDPEIFENTVTFNVALSNDVEASALLPFLGIAQFNDVLEKLPEGLATDVHERGANFSVGQKQRLALARGLYAVQQGHLLLMDEPTSSVDIVTESQIIDNLLQHFSKETIIISLHRLHLLPRFDRVILLEGGRIIADGHTTTLLQQPGPVRELWLSASIDQ